MALYPSCPKSERKAAKGGAGRGPRQGVRKESIYSLKWTGHSISGPREVQDAVPYNASPHGSRPRLRRCQDHALLLRRALRSRSLRRSPSPPSPRRFLGLISRRANTRSPQRQRHT
ncbi:uncharacterized protein LOC122257798 [Penaeus japonicus]|uniref:uncharacterized protein LOC122257798 n=1 Tax=Penaeus japonicus TaxID=27405 RepID=UPI001C70E2EB|nr:uncharacterized protein LOC122257798 [Penaeus japonicus]